MIDKQEFIDPIIIAKKFRRFPNLEENDVCKIISRSILICRDAKWREVLPNPGREERSASGIYNFVTREKTIFIRKANVRIGGTQIGHIDLALGREVDYAGKLYFSGRTNRGILRKWTNESGHYRPAAEFKHQAGLPEDLFQPGQFGDLINLEDSSM